MRNYLLWRFNCVENNDMIVNKMLLRHKTTTLCCQCQFIWKLFFGCCLVVVCIRLFTRAQIFFLPSLDLCIKLCSIKSLLPLFIGAFRVIFFSAVFVSFRIDEQYNNKKSFSFSFWLRGCSWNMCLVHSKVH